MHELASSLFLFLYSSEFATSTRDWFRIFAIAPMPTLGKFRIRACVFCHLYYTTGSTAFGK